MAEAEKYDDVELQVAEGTNDVNLQISQVETFINDKVDAIVLLPTDGAALTDVATKAMEAGIPVINVDREFSTPVRRPRHRPRRQLRHGRLRRHLRLRAAQGQGQQRRRRRRDRRHRLAAADPGPRRASRTRSKSCGQNVDNRVAAEFTVESGEKAASNLLQAAPKIDVIWNHDDDQGVGVMAAFDNAGRDSKTNRTRYPPTRLCARPPSSLLQEREETLLAIPFSSMRSAMQVFMSSPRRANASTRELSAQRSCRRA